MPDALPTLWVQKIFSKLAIRYGTAFRNRYAGINEQELWEDWAQQLAGFQNRPEAIAYALEYLPPDFPPTASAFRDLCRLAPTKPNLALPGPDPTPNPELMGRITQAIKAKPHDPKQWAWDLAKREAWQVANSRDVTDAERMTPAQRAMWREALEVPTSTPAHQAIAQRAAA
jgi:hypothetical protein